MRKHSDDGRHAQSKFDALDIKNPPRGLDPSAYELKEGQQYQTYIRNEYGLAEFTFKAVLSGAVLGIIFGAATPIWA